MASLFFNRGNSDTEPRSNANEGAVTTDLNASTIETVNSDNTDELFDDAFLRRLERIGLLANTPARGTTAGERTKSRSGAGLEFYDYRRYRAGDDVRHVDWNVSARLNQLFMKLLAAEVDTTMNILIDVSASMAFGSPPKFNYARQLAAALAVTALSNVDRIAITLFDSKLGSGLPLMKGKGHLRSILHFLKHCEAAGTSNFTVPFTDAVATRASPGILVVISDLLGDTDTLQSLHTLQSPTLDVMVLQILADEELYPTLNGAFKLLDAESADTLKTTIDAELIELYQQQIQSHLSDIEQTCNRLGFTYARCTTSQPLEKFIFNDLRIRNRSHNNSTRRKNTLRKRSKTEHPERDRSLEKRSPENRSNANHRHSDHSDPTHSDPARSAPEQSDPEHSDPEHALSNRAHSNHRTKQ